MYSLTLYMALAWEWVKRRYSTYPLPKTLLTFAVFVGAILLDTPTALLYAIWIITNLGMFAGWTELSRRQKLREGPQSKQEMIETALRDWANRK
ncbi:MAG: hypothetical protein AAF376_05650 [Pseudomonadota bacterium]